MNRKTITLFVLLALLLVGCVSSPATPVVEKEIVYIEVTSTPQPTAKPITVPTAVPQTTKKWCNDGRCYSSTECEESFEYMFELVWDLELTEAEEEFFFAGVLLEDWDIYSYGDIVQTCTYGGFLD